MQTIHKGSDNLKNITTLIIVGAVMFTVLGLVSLLSHIYNINNIKAKTVGDGQHGTARWARKEEIRTVDIIKMMHHTI